MFKLRRYLAGHYVECVLAPLFKGLEALLQLLVPLVMAQVIDIGIASHDAGYVLGHGALLVGVGVFAWVISVTAQYFCSKLASAFGTAMRDDLFRHVLSLSREDVERIGRASLVTRITNDSQQVQDGLNMFFRLILRSPFVTFGTVIAAFLVDGLEGAALLVAVLVSGAIVMGFMRVTTERYRQIQRGLDEVQLRVSENLEGARVLRAFRREDGERVDFAEAAGAVRARQVSTGDLSALVNPLTYAAINCGLIALLWIGGGQVSVGHLTQGQLVALVSYVSQALVELLKLTNLIMLLSRASACARRVNEVFETTPSMADGAREASLVPGEPAVAFDDVSFTYPGGAGHALSHVTFSLMPGQTLGVIGGTGSGKSTLASLLMRFYDVTEGVVRVGGADVRELTRRSLRRVVSLVEQGATLFSGTIASNLRWGGPDAGEKDLRAALETAQAAGVVDGKEGGLEAEVEQFGRNFSGGQRQRLAVARTLARRPGVLVLDDASSALDFATDAALRRAIRRDCADAAVIMISQRVTTVRQADQIIVLDGGRQAGLGTHEELLRDCPVYREICESQLTAEEVAR
ncbi:ABC transporter ATP-binding protein/permease [Thermophilibacter sp. ET337]|uniref:ABC transporter ATP-binding protein n=1 Tax=Thermophilibacter sp. ET337 TaxID=2973084 RepID=UPI0021ABD64B|nr:ABC transporter ATP-binding protein [Thermophilibacter sp. ET337]MCR8907366.1 ABC transporter ATP-binding protein/permease [Thermophilibacter sp. ET337]